MKAFDRLLQRWRIAKVEPYLRDGDRVLDIGCSQGELFQQFESRIGEGVGIDDDLDAKIVSDHYQLIPGTFPEGLVSAPLPSASIRPTRRIVPLRIRIPGLGRAVSPVPSHSRPPRTMRSPS